MVWKIPKDSDFGGMDASFGKILHVMYRMVSKQETIAIRSSLSNTYKVHIWLSWNFSDNVILYYQYFLLLPVAP